MLGYFLNTFKIAYIQNLKCFHSVLYTLYTTLYYGKLNFQALNHNKNYPIMQTGIFIHIIIS